MVQFERDKLVAEAKKTAIDEYGKEDLYIKVLLDNIRDFQSIVLGEVEDFINEVEDLSKHQDNI